MDDNEIEKRYASMSEEEKNKLIKLDIRTNLGLNIGVTSFFGLFAVLFFILIFCDKNNWLYWTILVIIFTIIASAFCLVFTLLNKASDEKKVKRQISHQIQRERSG